MTFTVDELSGGQQTQIIHIPISNISSSTNITLSNTGSEFTNLKVDLNGDNLVDMEITPAGEVILPPVEQVVTYKTLLVEINKLSLQKKFKKPLVTAVKAAEKISKKITVKSQSD